jgi:glycosyltransferase involved in cell wall biosynthesis
MKKILVSVNTSWNIINFRLGLLQSLQTKDFKIIILAPEDKYSLSLKKYGFDYYSINMNNKGTNPIEDFQLIVRYYKILKKIQPDIMLNYTIKPNIYGTIAASILNIPIVNNIAGLGTLFTTENFITKIAKILYKYSQLKANYVFFQNKEDFQLFIEQKLVDKNKCDVLPGSGVDTFKFMPVKKCMHEKIVFLLIARMLWDKGIGEYVEAARIIKRQYKNVEFQLLGFLDVENKTAISKDQMNIWISEGIIKYLGTSDDVRVEISNADCIVLPSFYREGTPRTLLESASMEKPIITTDNIGCKDVVEDEVNGYLCMVKNSQDLAKKIEKFICLTEFERLQMGKEGRKKIKKEFEEKIVIDRYTTIINKILKA